MCYSAQIVADYRRYLRAYGAGVSLQDFFNVFWRRARDGSKAKIPKALAAWFDGVIDVKALIDEFDGSEASRLEQELFKQRRRLADAERLLAVKPTKVASESKRVATAKIEQIMGWLGDLRRTTPEDQDARIFPGHYAPVIVAEGGRRVVKPMRYQCRPVGKPAFYDTKFPGAYNARRDNLEGGFWRDLFGYRHGILVVNAFFENVDRDAEGNVVLEFRPQPAQDMLVACLWSHWQAPGEPDLLSFAAVTDDPPPEIAAAGHDRCIVPIKPAHIDAWLTPDPTRLADQYAILNDRAQPYYEHRLAA